MLKIALIFVFLSGADTFEERHALYLSFSEVDFSNNSLQIKVFSDDLHSALKNYDKSDFAISNQNIQNYFDKYLELIVDGHIVQLDLLTTSKENDAHFLNFKLDSLTPDHNIKIKASFFMELFSTQQNVFNIKLGAKNRFLKLSKSDPVQSINFD